jgi:hypothetical protein
MATKKTGRYTAWKAEHYRTRGVKTAGSRRKRLGAGGSKTWVRVYITRSRQEASRNYPRTYSGYCNETEAVDIAILFDS